jgi:hypothetical protein
MAPKIAPTKRHDVSAWQKPEPVTSGRLAMSSLMPEDASGGGGGGWDDEDGDDLLGLGNVEERRKAAEARRAQRQREREASGTAKQKPARLAATKVYDDDGV